jgi:hypothetical protein
MSKARIAALAATLLAAGGIAFAAAPAHATSLTCTNTQSATTAPYGCGGLNTISGYAGGLLSLSTDGTNAYDSKPFVVEPTSTGATDQDFTVFADCGGSVACTSPADTSDGPGGLGVYVAAVTPGGDIANFTITGTPVTQTAGCVAADGSYSDKIPCAGATFTMGAGSYCLSVSEFTGPNGKLRWWAIERLCSTNGTFTYGTVTTPGTVTHSRANRWQEWAPAVGNGGLLMENVSLRNKFNSEYDLNITGAGGAGALLQAYQDNGGGTAARNDLWDYTACTPPGSLLSVFGTYGSC